MDVPDSVAEFVDEAIALGNPLLPCDYPAANELGPFQKLLPAEAAGAWLALCRNHTGEPYLVAAADPEGPVYFASAAEARWEPFLVAESLNDFAELLGRLQDLEADSNGAACWVEEHLDPDNDLWAEVAAGYRLSIGRAEAMLWEFNSFPGDADFGPDEEKPVR
ncbi:MAG: hypothetical protein LBI84_07940 [Propionibacteriaceae bacterium]|jgi:hypothetical protein|nr:hypothetical protein [Propionibacteriaceae bacterium]